ncbi:MAG: tetraacyldisaccharide 4-kinase [Pseudomonadota bacterium]
MMPAVLAAVASAWGAKFSRIPDHAAWRVAMYPLSLLYLVVVMIRSWLYRTGFLRTGKLGVRVISVGNIETGGTGKTPFVAGLCSELVQLGRVPVVLSRGHGSGLPGDLCAMIFGGRYVDFRHMDGSTVPYVDSLAAHIHADEAMMISNLLPTVPVLIGRDRYKTWQVFSRAGFPDDVQPTDVVLDDGFQHLAIARDIDVVLLTPGVGTRPRESVCLPSGNLREPLSALDRATCVVTVLGRDHDSTGAPGLPGERAFIRYGDLLLMSAGGSFSSPESVSWPRRPLVACGIARPLAFIDALSGKGLVPANILTVKDHEEFRSEELQSALRRDLSGNNLPCDAIITTAKDYWRNPQMLHRTGVPVWILPMSIEFSYHKLLSRA